VNASPILKTRATWVNLYTVRNWGDSGNIEAVITESSLPYKIN